MGTIEKYQSSQDPYPKATLLSSDGCISKTIEVSSNIKDLKIHHTVSVSIGNKFINILSGNSEITEMLIKAVNNRTRERNYFKLYCDLLDGTISDDEFDNQLSLNEDEYIVDENERPSIDKTKLALKLAENIKDVKTLNDLSSLFSFNPNALEELACI